MLPKETHNPGRYQEENEDISFQEDFCLVPHKCGRLETTLAAAFPCACRTVDLRCLH